MVLAKRINNRFPNWDEMFTDFFPELRVNNYNNNLIGANNITQNDTDYQVELVLAGIDKEDINISTENNVLKITAERNEGDKSSWLYASNVEKSFTLPDNVNADKIDAEYVNGILTVTIPKKKETIPKNRSIKIR